ncbi:hypothetical protein D9758_005211 [Tetrapyrgos nigripes]|uniref:Uncharacterized protein n=1 Tax=Tetrapyrgos nigripes TaxID=182062 RepID=A0A8H5LWU6_9AGAR|nr:hypothetical protein D9758_005211 [Tetrapyrgos nigripes]
MSRTSSGRSVNTEGDVFSVSSSLHRYSVHLSLSASEAQNQVLKDQFIFQTVQHAEELGRFQTHPTQGPTLSTPNSPHSLREIRILSSQVCRLGVGGNDVIKALKKTEDDYEELVEKKKDERTIEMQKKAIGEKTRMLAVHLLLGLSHRHSAPTATRLRLLPLQLPLHGRIHCSAATLYIYDPREGT